MQMFAGQTWVTLLLVANNAAQVCGKGGCAKGEGVERQHASCTALDEVGMGRITPLLCWRLPGCLVEE